MLEKFVEALLFVLVSFGLKFLLGLVGIAIDEVVFNTIVAGVVTALLALFFKAAVKKAVPSLF